MKVKEALELIENSLKNYDRSVVACSFGEDSLVVLHLVKQAADEFNAKEMLDEIGEHFENVSVEEFEKNLEKAGVRDIADPSSENMEMDTIERCDDIT